MQGGANMKRYPVVLTSREEVARGASALGDVPWIGASLAPACGALLLPEAPFYGLARPLKLDLPPASPFVASAAADPGLRSPGSPASVEVDEVKPSL